MTPLDSYVWMFRARKAHALAGVLRSHGASAADAARLPAEARRTTARIAGWDGVSDETWRAVCSVLASGRPRLGGAT